MRKSLRTSAPPRSRYRRLFVAIGTVVAVASVLIALVLATERWIGLDMHATYATLTDAKADGAVTRGWVPEWLPPSARDLQESHNLDTNASWLTFTFDAADANFPNARVERRLRGGGTVVEDVCESVAPEGVVLPWAPQRPWWPKTLRGSAKPPPDYAYYRCKWERGTDHFLYHYLAVDPATRRAWVWGNH